MNAAAAAPISPAYPRFAGRWVMVTGAGTGFGAAVAARAAAEGADVVVHYHSSRDGAERTAERVIAAGQRVVVVQADISRPREVDDMLDRVLAEIPGLDVLVNNTGDINEQHVSWEHFDEAAIDRMLAVTVKGSLLMTHRVGRHMLGRGRGSIVNVGSTSVVRGVARAPEYAASKYAIIGLTKSYAQALAPAVRVNTFPPGFMETESTLRRAEWESTLRPRVLAGTPMRRIPGPDELAAAALWLACDEAAHLTGSFLICDGGQSMIGA